MLLLLLLCLLHLRLCLLQLLLQLLYLRLLLLLLLMLQLYCGHCRLLLRCRLTQWLRRNRKRYMSWRGLSVKLRGTIVAVANSCCRCRRSCCGCLLRWLRCLKSRRYLLQMSAIQLIQIDSGTAKRLLQL